MGLLTFSLNVTLDGCVDHEEGIADDETHAFFTRLLDEGGAMLWGRVTYEMMESYWPAVARGDVEAPQARVGDQAGGQAEVCGVVDANELPVDQQPSHRRRLAHERAGNQKRDPGRPAPRQRPARDRAGPTGTDRRVQPQLLLVRVRLETHQGRVRMHSG